MFDPWVRNIPWRRAWQPTPVFLPGKSHEQRSLVGYSPLGHERVGHDLLTKQEDRKLGNEESLHIQPYLKGSLLSFALGCFLSF